MVAGYTLPIVMSLSQVQVPLVEPSPAAVGAQAPPTTSPTSATPTTAPTASARSRCLQQEHFLIQWNL